MSRTDTNKLLKELAESINHDSSEDIYITVVAGGQLITGRMISEDDFFNLSDNLALRDLFYKTVKEPREEALAKLQVDQLSSLSDDLNEYFIYLKEAIYMNAGLKNSEDEDGISVQIRVSDISAFTFRGALI